jgi:hypothetical protein
MANTTRRIPLWLIGTVASKRFLAIVDAFDEWRHLFERVQHEINVCSDQRTCNIS